MRKRSVEYRGLFVGNTLVLAIFGLAVVLMISSCSMDGITGEAKGGLSATNIGQGGGLGSGKGGGNDGNKGGKVKPQCNDGIDNDYDGYCDYLTKRTKCIDGSTPGDVDCASKDDDKEGSDAPLPPQPPPEDPPPPPTSESGYCKFQVYSGQDFIDSLLQGPVYVESAEECKVYGEQWKTDTCKYEGVYSNYLFFKPDSYTYYGQLNIPSGDCCCVSAESACTHCQGEDLLPIPPLSNGVSGTCEYIPLSEGVVVGSLTSGKVSVASKEACKIFGEEQKEIACGYEGIYTNRLYFDPDGSEPEGGVSFPSGPCCCIAQEESGLKYCVLCEGDLPPIPEGNDPACGTTGCACRFTAYTGQYNVDSLQKDTVVFNAQECQAFEEQHHPEACTYDIYTTRTHYMIPGSNVWLPATFSCCCPETYTLSDGRTGTQCGICPGPFPPYP